MLYFVTSQQQCDKWVAVLKKSSPAIVGLDIETWGIGPTPKTIKGKPAPAIDPLVAHIRTIQISWDSTTLVVDCTQVENVAELLQQNCLYVGHNLKFEASMLLAHCLPFPRLVWDTMLCHQILSMGTGQEQTATLADVAKIVLGIDVDKTYQAADWSQPLSPEML